MRTATKTTFAVEFPPLYAGLLSLAMAGFLSVMAVLSFPLPWTPVPFSMMPFGLLVVGAVQRPLWAAASVAMYLAAGAMGAPIFADGASGARHLFGATGGYLIGFLLVSPMVAAYIHRPRRVLAGPWRYAVLTLLGLGALAGLGAIATFLATGQHFSSIDSDVHNFGVGRSVAWIGVFLVAATTATALALRGRLEGRTAQALQLWMVMMAAVVLLHVCGIAVLMPVLGLDLVSAITVGSLVFLPFDTLKAALAVAATLPFLPAIDSEDPHA